MPSWRSWEKRVPEDTSLDCASCRHYNASRVPGKPGLCTLRGRASHWDSTCEEWEERLPFEEDLGEEEE